MAEILFSFYVTLCLSVCASMRSGPVNQIDPDQFKTLKATDFKFGVHVSFQDSLNMTP